MTAKASSTTMARATGSSRPSMEVSSSRPRREREHLLDDDAACEQVGDRHGEEGQDGTSVFFSTWR